MNINFKNKQYKNQKKNIKILKKYFKNNREIRLLKENKLIK